MIRLKFTKIMAVILAANLLVQPLLAPHISCGQVQAEETFANIHALYSYWCSNDYGNFPENVGDVYCYYYEDILEDVPDIPDEEFYVPEEVPVTTPAVSAKASDVIEAVSENVSVTTAAASPASVFIEDSALPEYAPVGTPATVLPAKDSDIVEVSADQNYVLVVGLIDDTPEAEQEILSKLQDKSHVAFASCKYTYHELQRVHKEIYQMMSENLGINGIGSTCDVDAPVNNVFKTMKNYVEVMIAPEFYETTAAMLIEKYGDKVRVCSGKAVTVDTDSYDCIEDCVIEEHYGMINGTDTDKDIGGSAYTIGVDGASNQNGLSFLQTTTALTLKDTFTFKGNWKKTANIVWTVTGGNKVKVLSKKANGRNFKIQAKKTGYVTITAKNKKNQKTVSEKVLILDKNGTVSNQEKLTAALQSKTVKKITIKTKGEKKFTIPEGDYGNKKIIMNAPKSEVTVEDQDISEAMVFLAGTINKGDDSDVVGVGAPDRPAEDREEGPVMDDMAETPSFLGTILEIYGEGVTALVEPEEGSQIRLSGDRVTVNLAINTTDNFAVGDTIRVYYDGSVAESYPLQIPQTFYVGKITEDDSK